MALRAWGLYGGLVCLCSSLGGRGAGVSGCLTHMQYRAPYQREHGSACVHVGETHLVPPLASRFCKSGFRGARGGHLGFRV